MDVGWVLLRCWLGVDVHHIPSPQVCQHSTRPHCSVNALTPRPTQNISWHTINGYGAESSTPLPVAFQDCHKPLGGGEGGAKGAAGTIEQTSMQKGSHGWALGLPPPPLPSSRQLLKHNKGRKQRRWQVGHRWERIQAAHRYSFGLDRVVTLSLAECRRGWVGASNQLHRIDRPPARSSQGIHPHYEVSLGAGAESPPFGLEEFEVVGHLRPRLLACLALVEPDPGLVPQPPVPEGHAL